MLFLRSLLFWLGMSLSTIIITPFIPFLYPVPYPLRYRYAHQWTRFNLWWLELTCGLKYRVTGADNITDTPAIIMAKHQSAWETMALQKMFPPQVWVMKREIFWIPFFGWAIAAMEPIAIDRASGRKAVKQIVEQGRMKLQAGRWVVIFPEGTRVPPGKKGRYGMGGAILATETGYPVVPVAHNAGEFWKRNDFIKRPGTIDVIIGAPIESHNKEPAQLNREVENWIEGTMQKISLTPYTGELHKRKS
jgi:1-acyl-sn-glycerol-3-phosphate acyltransferase